MTEQNPPKSIREDVLSAIKAGKVKMVPRWHFILKSVAFIVGSLLIGLSLLYVVSFIIFMLYQTGVLYAPGFGLRGFEEFVIALPWLLILLAAIFLVILQILVKHFAFSYARPLLYSIIVVISLVLIGGLIIALTPIHKGLLQQAQQDKLPLAGSLYRMYGMRQQTGNVFPGKIIALTEDGLILRTLKGGQVRVFINPETRFIIENDLSIGDKIFVIGDRFEEGVRAFAIRIAQKDLVIQDNDSEELRPPLKLENNEGDALPLRNPNLEKKELILPNSPQE